MNSTQAWLWLGLILIAGTLTKWLYTGFKIRCHVSQLRKQGLAMPPWSWLYGHLSFMRTTLKQYPPDILFSVVINDIYHKNFESSGLFYLDLWPFARPTLVVCNAASSLEVNRRLNTKPDEYKAIFSPQTNGPSLLNTNGKEWKVWRRSMNPGFAISNLMQAECVKNIIESIEVFCDILSNKARQGNVSPLEDSVSRCTLEVILRTATCVI
jgi:cytochrome P450